MSWALTSPADRARHTPAYVPGLVFAEYAQSGSWIAVHFAQWVGVMLVLGGLIGLKVSFSRSLAVGL